MIKTEKLSLLFTLGGNRRTVHLIKNGQAEVNCV